MTGISLETLLRVREQLQERLLRVNATIACFTAEDIERIGKNADTLAVTRELSEFRNSRGDLGPDPED